jgi:hypothetical protein
MLVFVTSGLLLSVRLCCQAFSTAINSGAHNDYTIGVRDNIETFGGHPNKGASASDHM